MKTAIVTGAGKGIGLAIAQKLADDGFRVIIAELDEAAARQAVQDIGTTNTEYHTCDISDKVDVADLFDMVKEKYGRENLHVVVNNAGVIRDHMIWKMTSEEFDQVISVNLRGVWLMCREAAKVFRENKGGRIINISSRAWLGNPGQTNYTASKAGVVGMTRSLALELGKYGATVNAVAPGLIDTPMTRGLPKDVLQRLIDLQPTKTMGTPADIAEMVAYLASDKASFITGQVLQVDGGKSVGTGI